MGEIMKAAIDFDTLPDDKLARAEVLELRTVPSTTKPRISPESEASLAGLEERTAQCYSEMEERTFRLRKLAKRIGSTVPTHAPTQRLRADSEAG